MINLENENLERLNKRELDERQKNRYIAISESLYANFDYLKKLFENNGHHNSENGFYNESLLMELFERELSSNYGVTSGFVVNLEGEMSTQFDLIIYDSQTPLIFNKGKVSIVPLEGVRAIIEVKTSIPGIDTECSNSLKNIINKLVISNKDVLSKNTQIVYGVFSYCVGVEIKEEQLKEIFMENQYDNIKFCISLNKNDFIVSFLNANTEISEKKYRHKLFHFGKDLSVGYFLDNIRYSVSEENNLFVDYLFPKNGKFESFKSNLN